MSCFQQQVLVYGNRESDILLIGRVLDLMGKGDFVAAQQVLVQYHDSLIMAQTPKTVDYRPELEMPR